MQNILLRLGLRYSLDIMLPELGNYIAYEKPISNQTIGEDLMPVDRKFNIFACHSRYHQNTMAFMYKDTIRVTLLRYPPFYFESLYNFFSLYKNFNMTFEQLLRSLPNASAIFTRKGQGKTKSVNQMCYELGFCADNASDTAIRSFIQSVDEEFDFVMITEYFDECLVLLADLMDWPLKYVAYLPLMSRTEAKKSNLTWADEVKLRELNRADSLLYEYFVDKLRLRMIHFGVDRLMKDLRTLRQLNHDLYKRCVAGKAMNGYGGTIDYKLKSDREWECVYASKGELSFLEEIRTKQRNRFVKEKKLVDLCRAV